MDETSHDKRPLGEPAKELIKLLAKIAVDEHLNKHFKTGLKDNDHETRSNVCKIQHREPE